MKNVQTLMYELASLLREYKSYQNYDFSIARNTNGSYTMILTPLIVNTEKKQYAFPLSNKGTLHVHIGISVEQIVGCSRLINYLEGESKRDGRKLFLDLELYRRSENSKRRLIKCLTLQRVWI